jgi:thiamine-monophosphate kinase
VKSEFQFIAGLRARARDANNDLIVGIGDDAAILRPSPDRELLITTDLLIEDIHFKFEYTPLSLLGHKALAVNLSDIAAMGGRPRFFLLSLARPRNLSDDQLDALMNGMLKLAQAHNTILIGGDTCAAPDRLFINITVIGECARGQAIARNGAKPGDRIYVSGQLGGSALGLQMLRAGQRLDAISNEATDAGALNDYLAKNPALRAHLAPQPRIALGAAIGDRLLATAMIDISDGLSSDLGHICAESGAGAQVHADAIPISDGATLDQALNGGEDYELLFTVSPQRIDEMAELCQQFSDINIACIGEIGKEKDLRLITSRGEQPLLPKGYDHFASDR